MGVKFLQYFTSRCSRLLSPSNHRPPGHLCSPTRTQAVGAPTPALCIVPAGVPRALSQKTRRRAAAAAPSWRSGSAAAARCRREAEMPGAAEPVRRPKGARSSSSLPSPRPGGPAGGAVHDQGRTVFHLPSTPCVAQSRSIYFRWSGSIRGDAVERLDASFARTRRCSASDAPTASPPPAAL